MLFTTVFAEEPSNKFNSAVVLVTPSNILSSEASEVTPSNIFSSAAVDVTVTPPICNPVIFGLVNVLFVRVCVKELSSAIEAVDPMPLCAEQ